MKVKYQIGFRIDDVLEERRLMNIDKDLNIILLIRQWSVWH